MKQIFDFTCDELAEGMFEYIKPAITEGNYHLEFQVIKNPNAEYGVNLQLVIEAVDKNEPTDL